jgi:hypothetical protein
MDRQDENSRLGPTSSDHAYPRHVVMDEGGQAEMEAGGAGWQPRWPFAGVQDGTDWPKHYGEPPMPRAVWTDTRPVLAANLGWWKFDPRV